MATSEATAVSAYKESGGKKLQILALGNIYALYFVNAGCNNFFMPVEQLL